MRSGADGCVIRRARAVSDRRRTRPVILTAENAEDYLQEDIILAVGGSWIASESAITSGDWVGITQRANAVMQ